MYARTHAPPHKSPPAVALCALYFRTNPRNIRRILKESMKGVPTGFAINRSLREHHAAKDTKNTQFMASPSMSVTQQKSVGAMGALDKLKRADSKMFIRSDSKVFTGLSRNDSKQSMSVKKIASAGGMARSQVCVRGRGEQRSTWGNSAEHYAQP